MKSLSDKDRRYLEASISDLIDAARLGNCCLCCEWFREREELCMLGGLGQRPPARVIVTGCPSFSGIVPF